MTPYIVSGLVVGSVYAIATLGLVLTYTSSRIFNFAHGAIALFLATTFYQAVQVWGWNPRLAGVLTIFVFSPLFGLFLWAVLFRQLTDTPPAVRLVSTIGLWVALPALTRIAYGHRDAIEKPNMLWSPPHQYEVLGVSVDSNQVAVVLAAVLIAVGMTLLLRGTSFGLSIRATVDSQRMAATSGINTSAVSAGAWMIGTTLAGTAGVLLGPVRGFDELQFTFLVLGSFAAVVVARMHSLVLAFVGSLLIGLLQGLSASKQVEDFLTHFVNRDSVVIRGLRPSLPFIIMLVFLLLYRGLGRERFTFDTRAALPLPSATEAGGGPLRRYLPLALLALLVLAAPELVSGRWLDLLAKGLALAIAFLSYTVVTGEGGMISLCQITFAGIAAALTAQFATNQGMSVLLAILLGALVAIPVGLIAALPSLRLGDLYLALATLSFALLVENTYYQVPGINKFGQGVAVPQPKGLGTDTRFYYLLVGCFALVALLVRNLKRSTTGLNLAAMRSSPDATATLGINIVWSKLVAFGLSAFIAGVGGGLYATYSKFADMDQYLALIGVVWLAVVVTWGIRSITGALLAGLVFATFSALLTELFKLFDKPFSGRWLELPTVLFGLGAIGLAREPRGIVYQVVYGHRARRHHREQRAAALTEDDVAASAEAAT